MQNNICGDEASERVFVIEDNHMGFLCFVAGVCGSNVWGWNHLYRELLYVPRAVPSYRISLFTYKTFVFYRGHTVVILWPNSYSTRKKKKKKKKAWSFFLVRKKKKKTWPVVCTFTYPRIWSYWCPKGQMYKGPLRHDTRGALLYGECV